MARSSFGPGNYSIRSERYRYIHYNDGSEEFYDHSGDPHEWKNLIENPELATLIKKHRAMIPENAHPILGKDSTGHKSFEASEAAKKETTTFDPLDWKRPVDNPVFTTTFGNNHDSVLFVDPELEYPYHLIISHTAKPPICGEPRNSRGAATTGNSFLTNTRSGNTTSTMME